MIYLSYYKPTSIEVKFKKGVGLMGFLSKNKLMGKQYQKFGF